MESTGEKNKIQVSSETFELIKDKFNCLEKRSVNVKGIGLTKTYLIG